MDRRSFLWNGGVAFAGMWLGAGTLAGCRKVDLSGSNHRVLIIGAGVAGLAAATILRKAGLQQVTVLEASDRHGGRLFTRHDWGFPIDLGASWIHGPSNRNPLKDLATNISMDLFVTDDDSVKVYDTDGSQYSDDKVDDSEKEYDQLIRDIQSGGSKQKSVLDRLMEVDPGALNNRLRLYELSSYGEFDFGADIRQLSSLYLEDDKQFRGKDEIVTNGYDRLANLLAHKVNILYRQAVNRIEYVGSEWKVSTPVMDHFADEVIVAVPLGVLKAGTIAFAPNLPDSHLGALSRMQMGVVNKVVLRWDAPFWDTGLQYIGYTPTEKGKYNYFLNFRKFSSHNVLMTFAFGDYATQMEGHSDAQVEADIMAHLRVIYGNNIPNPVSMVRSKWGSDPFFGGSYTAAMVGMDGNEFETLAEPAGDRLHLAGEHCSQNYRGTVHGAYLSGEAVAERIIDKLDR